MRLGVTVNAQLSRRLHDAVADALTDIAEDTLRESNEVAPIEEGTLIRSGFTEVDRGGLVGQVAYDTPYAVRQHEDPELKHDPGRKDHFLSDVVEANRQRHIDYLQRKIADAT